LIRSALNPNHARAPFLANMADDSSKAMTGQIALDLLCGADQRFMAAVWEIVSPLAARFSGQGPRSRRIQDPHHRSGRGAPGTGASLPSLQPPRRHEAPASHRHSSDRWRCQCCAAADVLDTAGQRSPFAEYDHFYASSHPDPEHTGLMICKPCHTGLTTGRAISARWSSGPIRTSAGDWWGGIRSFCERAAD
jgi:hypothetical protein